MKVIRDICERYGVNQEQARALDISASIAVRAGAGSGKTRVLTRRFIRLLLEDPHADIDSIVAITFTRKAAAEMKDRIRRELSDRIIKCSDPYEKRRLSTLRMRMAGANIDTIHGFCAKLLRENFAYLGIDPNFNVMDEIDRDMALSRIADEVIREFVGDPQNARVVEVIAQRQPVSFFTRNLKEGILSAFRAMVERGCTPEDLRSSIEVAKGCQAEEHVDGSGIQSYEAYGEARGPHESADDVRGEFDGCRPGESFGGAAGNLLSQGPGHMGQCGREDGAEGAEADIVPILEEAGLRLIERLYEDYSRYKDRENMLDFNDLELYAFRLLSNPHIRSCYHRKFSAIMVDEFQDLNPLQKKILDLLTHVDGRIPPGRLFIVGDYKQSIYGFRGSDYRVFEEGCKQISEHGGRVERLSNCYRSTRTIIDFVNGAFKHLLDPYEPLKYPEQAGEEGYDEPKVELITWDKDDFKQAKPRTRWDMVKGLLSSENSVEQLKAALEGEYGDAVSAGKKDYQGDVIAAAIHRLVSRGFDYGDIAILLRSRSSLAQVERALTNHGIPYCVLGGIGFWSRQEVMDILALYRLVFHLNDRLALFTVLRSPIFGFSDDLLLQLAGFIKENGMEHAGADKVMEAFLQAFQHEEALVVQRAASILKEVSGLGGITNAAELFDRLVELTGYDEILLALPYGEKKLRNLEKLLGIVERFEDKGIYTARDFLVYVDAVSRSSDREEEASLDSEDSNAVKILTIHASKGLEFRAVLIPDMDQQLDAQAKKNKPLFLLDEHDHLVAIGIDDEGKFDESLNPAYAEIFNRRLLAELEESRRLFYVAATRARKYLGLIGQRQDLDEEGVPEKLNSFMKQLMWAARQSGTLAGMAEVKAEDLMDGLTECQDKSQGVFKGVNVDGIFVSDLKPLDATREGSISVSAWLKYKSCPRRFYLENILDLKQDRQVFIDELLEEGIDEWAGETAPVDLGINAHLLLREVDVASLSALKTEMLTQFADELGIDIRHDVSAYKGYLQGLRSIEEQRAKEVRGQLVDSLREYAFRVPIEGNLYFSGIVDRIDIYREEGRLRATVIDYKTNRVSSAAEARDKAAYYYDQLVCYSWALDKVLYYRGESVAVDEAVIYFLNAGQAIRVPLDKEYADEVINRMKAESPALLGMKPFYEYKFKKSEACALCPVRRFCGVIVESN